MLVQKHSDKLHFDQILGCIINNPWENPQQNPLFLLLRNPAFPPSSRRYGIDKISFVSFLAAPSFLHHCAGMGQPGPWSIIGHHGWWPQWTVGGFRPRSTSHHGHWEGVVAFQQCFSVLHHPDRHEGGSKPRGRSKDTTFVQGVTKKIPPSWHLQEIVLQIGLW